MSSNNKSVYSSFYDETNPQTNKQSENKNYYKITDDTEAYYKDPYNKSKFSLDEQPSPSRYEDKTYSPSSPSTSSGSTYYDSMLNSTQGKNDEESTKTLYIQKIRSNSDLLPIEFRNKIRFASQMNFLSAIGCNLYAVSIVAKCYPDFDPHSKFRLFSSFWVLMTVNYLVFRYQANIYEKAWNGVRSRHTNDEIIHTLQQHETYNRSKFENHNNNNI